MTIRLYHQNPGISGFTSKVIEITSADGGPGLVLDRTAFYATAGGQPNDLGNIFLDVKAGEQPDYGANAPGVAVVDVTEREDGAIVHILASSPPFGPGDMVTGWIDVPRRTDYTQQHSGQHLLSQAFLRTIGANTLSVHFGAETSTIDLDTPALTLAQLAAAEDEANRAVSDNLDVIVREVPESEVGQFGLRKPPKVSGLIRVVEFKNYDWSACGGTHVTRSGQVGFIALSKVEKQRSGIRVAFHCGGRALRQYRSLVALSQALSERLMVGAPEFLPALDRIRDEAHAMRARLSQAQDRLMAYEAAELQARARQVDGANWVAAVFTDREPGQLRGLAKVLVSKPGTVALLASAGAKCFLCFSRAPDAKADMAGLLRTALGQLGARGGGASNFAQGGGPAATLDRLEAILKSLF